MSSTYTLHTGDLPAGLDLGPAVAVDTETMGLEPRRDRLCLVQLSSGNGHAHLVQVAAPYDCPNLKALLADPAREKLFHFGRFDVAVIEKFLGVVAAPLFCTKIASKLVRTFTDRHGLKDICKELLGIDLSKQQQSSDWGAPTLAPEQLAYAATDVLYLHALQAKLLPLLVRESRLEVARACFTFLPTKGRLDLLGWDEEDIFSH